MEKDYSEYDHDPPPFDSEYSEQNEENEAHSDQDSKKKSDIQDEASGWAKMLTKLRGELSWRIYLVNGNRFIYRKTDAGYYETLVGPANPKDTLPCKMEIRTHFRNLPPSVINNLFEAILQEEHRLIDANVFIESRKKGIPFLNGVLDFETGWLRAYREDDFFCDPVPHHLSMSLNLKSIRYFRKVVRAWVNGENAQWVIDLIAYMLFVFPNVESLWLNPFGGGRNGKSSFISLLEVLIGKERSIGINLADLNKHTSASFIGKMLIVGRDSDPYVNKRGISLIKNYSGDKYVIVEPKGGFQYDSVVEGKMCVSTNSLVRSQDRTYGWYRRLLPIPFPNSFEQDSTFEDRLFKHVPGILTYLVCKAVQYKRKPKKKKLSQRVPRDIQVLRMDTQFLNDRVAAFWDLEFFDDDGFVILDKLIEVDGWLISGVWKRFEEWHHDLYGEKEKVVPSFNNFCGAHGEFMQKAKPFFTFKRDRKGSRIYLIQDKRKKLEAIEEEKRKAQPKQEILSYQPEEQDDDTPF